MFTRGGVYRVVKEAMGGTMAKLSVSALIFDFILTGPISGVAAGQYIVGLVAQSLSYFGYLWDPSDELKNLLAAGVASIAIIYFWWRNIKGIHESSDDALRIMYITTVMVVLLILWSLLTMIERAGTPLAGHLPPLLLSADEPPRLDTTEAGTPLGWASPRAQYAFRLPPGNTAVLYSDGLVENRKRGLDAGLDELVAVAGQAPADVVRDPERLLGYLVERMLTGYEQDDDVTVLVLHIPLRGEPPPAGPPAAAAGSRRGKG
jgi:hypothetical protein